VKLGRKRSEIAKEREGWPIDQEEAQRNLSQIQASAHLNKDIGSGSSIGKKKTASTLEMRRC